MTENRSDTSPPQAPPRRWMLAATAVAAVTLGGLTACSGTPADPQAAPTTGCPVSVADPWVKSADAGMTAAFGTLTTAGSQDVTITGAATPAAGRAELHEVVADNGQSVMRPVAGGLSVPAGGSLTLEPGGFHIMLMDVKEPIKAGDEVSVTLTCANGSTTGFTAPARDFAGGSENYQPSAGPSPAMS